MSGYMSPGGGGRFKKLEGELAGKGVRNPGALAASIGRKKYGAKSFNQMAHEALVKKTMSPTGIVRPQGGVQHPQGGGTQGVQHPQAGGSQGVQHPQGGGGVQHPRGKMPTPAGPSGAPPTPKPYPVQPPGDPSGSPSMPKPKPPHGVGIPKPPGIPKGPRGPRRV